MTLLLDTETEILPAGFTTPCERCGADIKNETIAKRISRGQADAYLCSSCVAKPATQINYGDTTACKPWQGDVDLDTMQPLDDRGRPYLPGARRCGHADCVNRKHIIRQDDPALITLESLIAEQFDLSYRTGKKLTYEQLIAKLNKEKRNVNV